MPSSCIYIYHITQVEGLTQNAIIYDVEKTDPAAPAEYVIELVSPQDIKCGSTLEAVEPHP